MAHPSQFDLLAQRRFAPFFWTQFLGAANDNIYKNALIIFVAYHAAAQTTLDANTLVNLAAGLFILPFMLFSATAGQLADKYEKSRLIRFIKVLEIGIMVVGAVGFLLPSLVLLFVALFLMGVHSTLFGPVKYAILPQHLRNDELVGGNGLVEMGTFVAILLGTIAGGLLVAVPGVGPVLAGCAAIGVAIAGWLVSRAIPLTPAVAPALAINWNPVTETWRNIRFAYGNRIVWLSMLGISWFWFYGATFLTQFPNFAKNVLGGDEHVVTFLLALFSVGIGTGSLLCERLSGRKVEIGLVPFGSIGLTVFAVDLWFATSDMQAISLVGVAEFLAGPGHWRVVLDLVLIGLFGGFFIVPLYALIQERSDPAYRSRIIAANNILNALFMVAGALAAAALLGNGLSIPALFGVAAVCNAAVALYIYGLVPEFLQRFVIWLLVHALYRFKPLAVDENIPEEGAAVLVCNHVSSVDALLIMAACRRPVRFVVEPELLQKPLLAFVLRQSRAIPMGDEETVSREMAATLEAGELVGLFPEGRPTPDGELQTFDPRYERLLAGAAAPVVPLALRGMWDSPFSAKPGSFFGKWLARGLAPAVALAAGIVGGKFSSADLQEAFFDLQGDCK